MDVNARSPDCDGQAVDAVSAHTRVKLEDAPRLLKIPKSECPDVSIRLPRHTWPKSWATIDDPVVPRERNLYGHPLAGLLWKDNSRKFYWNLDGQNCELGMSICWLKTKGYFCQYMWMTSKMARKKQNMTPMWKTLMKNVELYEPTSFLDHEDLGCTQCVCKPDETIIERYTKMFESRISAGATEKLPRWEKPRAKTVAWSYDMEGHAQTCVERYCEMANKKVEQLYKVSSAWMTVTSSKKNSNQLENCQKFAHNLFWNACTWHELGGQTFYGPSTNLQDQWLNGLRHATDDQQDWFPKLITRITIVNIVMWETRLSIVDWVYSKTQTLLAPLRIRHQLRGESCVSSEGRSKLLSRTVLQSLKSFLWMLDYAWMGFLLSISGT